MFQANDPRNRSNTTAAAAAAEAPSNGNHSQAAQGHASNMNGGTVPQPPPPPPQLSIVPPPPAVAAAAAPPPLQQYPPSPKHEAAAPQHQPQQQQHQQQQQPVDDDVLVDTDDEKDEKEATAAAPLALKHRPAANNNTANASSALLDPHYYHSDHEDEDAHATEGDVIGLHDNVEFIKEVEWAADGDTSVYGELAARPKPEPMGDPCGCTAILPDPAAAADLTDPTNNNTAANNNNTAANISCMDPSCILFACQEECRSNCEAGRFCGNKRIQRKEYKAVEVFHAGPKGRGLRACEPLQRGDFIMEYIGRAVRASYLAKLFQRYKQERRLYIMALDANVYLDARKKGSIARYINHSCDPNCVVERWKVRGIIRAGIFATRPIAVGEELSFDYQWERKKGRAPTKCYCGAPQCRGTLEVSKSLEEVEFEKSYEGHWKVGSKSALTGRELINRSIRILSQEHQQYFYADICKFDEKTKKHLVIYRYDWEEVWEDLAKEEWQLLDEDVGQNEFVIAKKARPSSWHLQNNNSQQQQQDNMSSNTSSLLGQLGAGNAGDITNAEELRAIQPYLYVQTPIKEAFWAKHLVQRCERNCRVTISATQFSRPPMAPDPSEPDEVQKHKALDESLDGSVWKLSVSGYNVAKACTILEKNVTYLTKQWEQQQQQSQSSLGGDGLSTTGPGGMKKPGSLLGLNRLTGSSSNGALSAVANVMTSTDNLQEVVMPRCIVDIFKRRLPLVRQKCGSVQVNFVHSESKSKAFAKLVLEATLQSDMYTARDSVWSFVNQLCGEVNAPKTHSGVFYRDVGFMGGKLTREQFRLLLQDDDDQEGDRLNQDCREDLRRSPFFTSFQSSQRCSVWVQSEEDKGRIDVHNNVVGEAVHNTSRNVFFGCDPKDIHKLWGLVETRANEVDRGVKYLFLGVDRVYQPFMIGGKFFDYVKRVTGASVMIDHMTGDHLRIDGRSYLSVHKSEVIDLENDFSESDRVALAEEMIRLQIEIYRDHCIRQQNWIFGRDWTLSIISTTEQMITDTGSKASSVRLQFDEKSVANSCQEIADITAALGTSGSAGVSAAIIFYRFVTLVCQREDSDSQLKVREIVLACVFLANKAQKVSKWRRLDAVLEAAYQVFYPGSRFDGSKEEVLILGEKVLLCEMEILNVLDFDVFWRGTEWILAAAVEAAGFKEALANEVLAVASSGPLLAAGSTLWLKYGVKYVFAAAAGFLQGNLEALCPALSLIPLKVLQAAEIIAESVKLSTALKRGSSHALFDGGKEALLRHMPRIKDACVKCMAFGLGQQGTRTSSETEQRYLSIGSRDCRRHVIQGVPRSLMKGIILPGIDGASAESKCNIFIGESAIKDADDIVFEGSWRAVAIADHLLRASVARIGKSALPPAVDISVELDVLNRNKLQAKVEPGLLNMGNVYTSDGWNETIQSEVSGAATWGRKTGGKICVAGKLAASSLREVGLRWWIPPQHGPSPTGSICDMFLVRSDPSDLFGGLQRLAESFLGESKKFPKLGGLGDNGIKTSSERYVAVSLQRWPSEKVEHRELEKSKKSKRSAGMAMGFSAAALQEMQLLNELHSVIMSPQGHPNFILPVALALPPDEEEEEEEPVEKEAEPAASTVADDIFSLFRTSEQNEKVARREKKMKDFVTGPHLVFQPSPFLMARFMSPRKKRKGPDEKFVHGIGPAIFSAWVHDMLSALVHCHTNHVVVRSFQADQVIIDHSGVAKLGGLYRATVVTPEDRKLANDPLKSAPAKSSSKSSSKSKKDRKGRVDDDDDVTSNPYIAPEHLFGSTRHTKESDIWSLGCLLANVLLNKTFYSGKDRQALLSSMYKVVGTPARKNFEICARLPHYVKPLKKYKRGVEKAFQHILKEDSEKHIGAIDLLSKMLHLDPNERITAAEALRHQYMLDYLKNSNSEAFRHRFVEDWMSLKGKLMNSTQGQEDDAKVRGRDLKRKAMVLAASTGGENDGDDQDDLYNLDELFATGDSKKPKL